MLCLYQLTVWSLVPLALANGLHVNILSVALWGREWVMVSYKHPNLPGWVMESAEELFGTSALMAYGLAQIFVAATIGFAYLLARDLFGDRWRAAAAVALLPSVFFFAVPSILFNHNIVQMPFWVAFLWAFNRVLEDGSMKNWLLTALIAALSMYVKLSSGLLLTLACIFLIAGPAGRGQLRRGTPWLAGLLFLVALIPLLYALATSGFQPLTYASERAAHANQPLLLIAATLAILASPVAVLWLAGTVAMDEIPRLLWPHALPFRQRFLLWFSLSPIVFCVVAGFVSDIRVLWLTPMFSLWGAYLLGNLPRRPAIAQIWRVAATALAVNVAMLAAYGGVYVIGNRFAAQPLRWEDWPQGEITSVLEQKWAEATHGAPLAIVGGPAHLGGAVAFWAKDEPSFYENLAPALSPWITPQRIAEQGMLVVWEDGDATDTAISSLLGTHPGAHVETLSLPWSTATAARPVSLRYLIIPPAGGGAKTGSSD